MPEEIEPSERGEYELADAIDFLLSSGHEFKLFEAEGWLVNVNTRADMDRAAYHLNTKS